jgi:hypothetical protein
MQSQLFTNITSESHIGNGYISIITDDLPGSTPEDPITLFMDSDLPYQTFPKWMRAIWGLEE